MRDAAESVDVAGPDRGRHSTSLIIAAYNQPRALELTLGAVANQARPADEIVIADDGSGPATLAVIERMRERCDLPPTTVLTQPDAGFRKTVALNRAIQASSGRQLLFLDGDVVPLPDWTARHRAAYRPMGYAVGDYVRLNEADSRALFDLRNLPGDRDARIRALAAAGRGTLRRRDRKARFHILCRTTHRPRLLGGNFSIDRALMLAVNGFDERFVGVGGEDANLRNRCNRSGGRATSLVRTAKALHVHRHLDGPGAARNRTSYTDSPLRREAAGRRALRGLAERDGDFRSCPSWPLLD